MRACAQAESCFERDTCDKTQNRDECPIVEKCDIAKEKVKLELQGILNESGKYEITRKGKGDARSDRFWWCRWIAIKRKNDVTEYYDPETSPHYTLLFRCDDYTNIRPFNHCGVDGFDFDYDSGNPVQFRGIGRTQLVEAKYRYKSIASGSDAIYYNETASLKLWEFPGNKIGRPNDGGIICSINKRPGEVWPIAYDHDDRNRLSPLNARRLQDTLNLPQAFEFTDSFVLTNEQASKFMKTLNIDYKGCYFHVDDLTGSDGDELSNILARLFYTWVLAIEVINVSTAEENNKNRERFVLRN